MQHTIILGEVIYKMGVHDLLFQQILFVQEQNDRRMLEPWVRDDRLEQRLWFFHSILEILENRIYFIYFLASRCIPHIAR